MTLSDLNSTQAIHWRTVLIVAFVGAICSGLPLAREQAFVNGSITGTVTDASGGSMPDVRLTLTNVDTSAKLDARTDSSGFYRFLNLPPGRYQVQAEKEGFQRLVRGSVVVEVNNIVRIDLSLQVGAVTQTVSVTAQTPLLQPETSSLGEVIEGRGVTEMPLNGRNPMALAALVPGVVPQGVFGLNMVTQNSFAAGDIQINGGFANESQAYWDGAPLMAEGYVNEQALIPTQDAVQEFKVMTDNLSAEYDRFAGGIISFTTKTGTNQAHGSAYEYLRNKVLNSNNFFNNRSGIAVPAFTQNQFGATLGGPVYLPHLYDGRDKTFFFVNFDGFRLRQGQAELLTVPTAAERAGDFTNTRSANGNVISVYDPTSTVLNPTTGLYTRTQLSCNGTLNVICPGSLNPTAKILVNLWALPNLPGAANTQINNWAGNASTGGDDNNIIIRVDRNVSDKQRFFARFSRTTWNDLPVDVFQNFTYVPGGVLPQVYRVPQVVIDDSYSFSPMIVGDFMLSYLRAYNAAAPGNVGYNVTQLGPGWAPIENTSEYLDLPAIGMTEQSTLTGGRSVTVANTDDWDFRPNLSIVHGRLALKFGFDLWVSRLDFDQQTSPTGSYTFNGLFTASSPFSGVGGYDVADLMLGAVANNTGVALQGAPDASQIIYKGGYAQDSVHVTKKLTLNLGLRYSWDGPYSERHNNLSTFLPNAVGPWATATGLPLKGALGVVASTARPSRNSYNADPHEIGPRFGFGYQLNNDTVVRGGYGIFWLPSTVMDVGNMPGNDPIGYQSNTMVSSTNGGLTPYNLISDPFPNGLLVPAGHAGGAATLEKLSVGQAIQINVPTTSPYGYAQQWNFDVQREMPGSLFLEAGYAGAHGVNIPKVTKISTLNPQYLSLGNALNTSVPNPFYGVVPAASPLNTPTTTNLQLLLPYPQYGNVIMADRGWESFYNSLQVKMHRRFSGGQTVLVAYTNGKLIANSDSGTNFLEAIGQLSGQNVTQNFYDRKSELALANYDVSQRFVASYVVDLPVGTNKHFLSGAHGPVGKFVTGWGASGVTTFQRGVPEKLTSAKNLLDNAAGVQRPTFNSTACPHGAALSGSAESRLAEWFNISCYSQTPAFTFGDVAPTLSDIRLNGLSNFDLAVFKNTYFGPEDLLSLQFRAEAFNLFNTPEFGRPGGSFGSASFGVVSSMLNNPRLIQFGLKLVF